MLMKSGSPAPGVRPLRAFYSSSRCHVIADVPTLHHLPQQFHLSLPKCECGGDTDCGENRTRLPPQPDYPADDHAAREQVLPLAAVFETDGEVALAAADLAGAAPPPLWYLPSRTRAAFPIFARCLSACTAVPKLVIAWYTRLYQCSSLSLDAGHPLSQLCIRSG